MFGELNVNMATQTIKDIQSVDSQYLINKGFPQVSVDKYGDMCIKGHKSASRRTVLHQPAGGRVAFLWSWAKDVSCVTFHVNHA